jgi:hypothetical protein
MVELMDAAAEIQQSVIIRKLEVGSRRWLVLSCIVSSRHLATTSEQTEDFIRAVFIVIYIVCVSQWECYSHL